MNNRAFSLDALRGYAIITMILSGTIASGVLPGWMYHAQLPPPAHQFDPGVYGITWVDLVFPFFLFAMGAAFPFSIGNKYEKGISKWKLTGDSLLRGVRLTFFAIFIQHMYPWVTSSPQDTSAWLLAIFAFLLMFPMFMRIPLEMRKWQRTAIELAAYAVGIFLLLTVSYAKDRTFSLSFSNIIILVLANMAIFGSVAYILTIGNKWARIGILPFVMAVFLGSNTEGSWIKEVMDFSPVPWMYKFYYLKYLFIVIPGSIAGGYLKEWLGKKTDAPVQRDEKRRLPFILLLSVGIIVFNLYGLYMRYLVLNLIGTILLLACLYYLLWKTEGNNAAYWRKLFTAGTYLLMLGLFFEAYEGGIRKDHSTYSYYFVTSGLAFMALIAFSIMCDVYRWKALTTPLQMAGQNPMIAYVAPQLLVMPILNLTGLAAYLNLLSENAWLGFLRGVIVTTLAVLVAMGFTKIKWFWRT
ncbi:DUF5009 domain-containing protein [Bacteroides sp. 51]|uniref:DUF5009 domain-containing protein n=1 Tax=Bacteroides sp. 51 TaxID=2302938 RepID=UPI0013D33AB0|nr:DUF5009 domain-containing protein [Bacteroides sp. 51]NDV81688.1 DUF5009 domain-containing protein [Bacteroides sp. 51]